MIPIILEFIKLLLAGIAGGLIGAKANDRLTRNRDADGRKRDFVGFLSKWRSEISSPSPKISGAFYYPDHVAKEVYRNELASFNSKIAMVRLDFINKQEFDALTKRLAGLTEKDLQVRQPSEVILEALDALIRFCV
jgi:hypothetical protein